jgi:hypothetical protein
VLNERDPGRFSPLPKQPFRAIGATTATDRNREKVRSGLAMLREDLEREREPQPLHNRLILLWASARCPQILSTQARVALRAEILGVPQAGSGMRIL